MVSPPKPIVEALAALADRQREVAQAQRAYRLAQRGVAAARNDDTAAIASALDAGQKPPGRKLEAAAERKAHDAQGELEVAQQRVASASARVDEAVEAEASAWVAAVEEAMGDADAAALEAVKALGAALSERNRLIGLRGWVRGVAAPSSRAQTLARPEPAGAPGRISTLNGVNGEPLAAEEVLAGIAAHVEETAIGKALDSENARDAERERAERIQAEHDAETARREADDLAHAQHPSGPRQVIW
jgi:hypothetical protein